MNIIIWILVTISLCLIGVFIKYGIKMTLKSFREKKLQKEYSKLIEMPPIAKCYCAFCKWYYKEHYCDYHGDFTDKLDFCSNASPKKEKDIKIEDSAANKCCYNCAHGSMKDYNGSNRLLCDVKNAYLGNYSIFNSTKCEQYKSKNFNEIQKYRN